MNGSEQSLIAWESSEGLATARIRYSQQRRFEEYEQISRELGAVAETEGVKAMVLNLAELEYLASRLLGVLAGLHHKLARDGRTLSLCRVRPEALRAFKLSRMDRIIPVFTSEEEARAAFAKLRSP